MWLRGSCQYWAGVIRSCARGCHTCTCTRGRCHLYPGDVGPHVEEPPDQLAQRGPQHGVPHPGLALGHAEHALVRGPEGHQVPGEVGCYIYTSTQYRYIYLTGGLGQRCTSPRNIRPPWCENHHQIIIIMTI